MRIFIAPDVASDMHSCKFFSKFYTYLSKLYLTSTVDLGVLVIMNHRIWAHELNFKIADSMINCV